MGRRTAWFEPVAVTTNLPRRIFLVGVCMEPETTSRKLTLARAVMAGGFGGEVTGRAFGGVDTAFADLSIAVALAAGEAFVGAVEVGGALTREALGIDGVLLAGWEDSVFGVAAVFAVTLNPAGPPSDGLGCG